MEHSRDPRTRKRLRKLTASALAAFAPPSFHGCTKYHHCLLGNVCISRRDGVFVPNVSGAASIAQLDRPHDAMHPITKIWRARSLPMSQFKRLTNVYYAEGKTYVAGCWRQGVAGRNPSHYMIGYGKLFAAAHDNRTHIVPRNMDHLVFHQCPPREPEDWEWARRVWSIIEREGLVSGLWKPGRPNIITMAHRGGPSRASQLPAKNELVVCAERMTIERERPGLYLGVNHPDMVRHWRRTVDRLVTATGISTMPEPQNQSRAKCEGCLNKCREFLRIGIFQRTEGRSGLRRLRNLDEVQALAQSLTRVPVKMVTLTSASSFEEQLWAFRSLDLLITPHGSQVTNMIFAPRTVFVELQAAIADTSFERNGRRLAAGYILSVGHLPVVTVSTSKMLAQPCDIGVERGMVRLMSSCLQRVKAKKCSTYRNSRRLVNTDLLVNITQLSADLAAAVAIRCQAPCSACVAMLPSAAPAPALQSHPCPHESACWGPDGPAAKYSSACKRRAAAAFNESQEGGVVGRESPLGRRQSR